MAVYLKDSGSYGVDAEMEGVEGTDWSRDSTNQTLKFLTDTGKADTGFILPSSSAWLKIESYNINGQDTGSVMWRSLDHWQTLSTNTIINDVLIDFRTNMATIIGDTNITSYDAKATLFDGISTAKVYEADETIAFSDVENPTYTVSDYTPSVSSYKLSNTLIAPEEVIEVDRFSSLGTLEHENGASTSSLTGRTVDIEITTVESGGNSYRRPYFEINLTGITEAIDHELKFDLSTNSGEFKIYYIVMDGGGTSATDPILSEGANSITVTSGSSSSKLYVYTDGRVAWDALLTNIRVVEA